MIFCFFVDFLQVHPFELKYSNRGIDSRQGAKHAKFGGER